MGFLAIPANKWYTPEIFQAKLAALYIGFFDRIPDANGFNWHLGQAAANEGYGTSGLHGRAQQFSEAIEIFAGQGLDVGFGSTVAQTENMTDFIENVYANVFSIPNPPASAVSWWLSQFNAENPGAAGSAYWHEIRGSLVLNMIDDFLSNDYTNPGFGFNSNAQAFYFNGATELNNKVQAGLMAVDAGYNPTGNAQQITNAAQALTDNITHDVGTVKTALNGIVSIGNNDLKIVVGGQSNAANFGDNTNSATLDAHYISNEYVTFIDSNGIERAYTDQWRSEVTSGGGGSGAGADPDFNTSSFTPAGGSIWGRLGDDLINQGKADKVTFDTQAVGSTSITTWSSGNTPEWQTYAAAIQSGGVDASIFIQGETDATNGMSHAVYESHMINFINRVDDLGVNLDLYIGLNGTFATGANSVAVNSNIHNAQVDAINSFQVGGANHASLDHITVKFGANHDSATNLNTNHRNDGDAIHSNAAGQDLLAAEYAALF